MSELKLQVAIVDDEPPARQRLRHLLQKTATVEIVAECCTGREAIECINTIQIDLMFLDIQMPEMNGIEVMESAEPARIPEIVFVTAYDDWAIRAFELNAMDYLLKPFDNQRFECTLQRATHRIQSSQQLEQANDNLARLLSHLRTKRPAERILVKAADGLQFINVNEISSIQAAGKFVKLFSGSKTWLVKKSMKQILDMVGETDFVRIHRAHIVSLQAVKRIEPYFHGDYRVTLTDGRVLPVSRNYKSNLMGGHE